MSTIKNKTKRGNEMKKGIVAIYVFENEYAERLMEYIEQKNGLPFNFIAFTQKEEIVKYLEKEAIHILLLSENGMDDIEGIENIEHTILLSEGSVKREHENIPTIYKYQSSENILRELMKFYLASSKCEEIYTDRNEAEIVGVYSPINSDQKTLTALLIGQIYASKKRTLYINLEEFAAVGSLIGIDFDENISDLMYFFRQNTNMVNLKLQATIRNYNQLDIIPPVVYSLDLRKVETNWWTSLIEKIASSGVYDVIVLDIGNVIEDVFKVIGLCAKVYMPQGQTFIEKNRINLFESYLLRDNKDNLLNKISIIDIPNFIYDGPEEKLLEHLLWGKEGDIIRNILENEGSEKDGFCQVEAESY